MPRRLIPALTAVALSAACGACRAPSEPALDAPAAEFGAGSGAATGEGTAEADPADDGLTTTPEAAPTPPPDPRLDGVAGLVVPGIDAPRDARHLAGVWQHDGQWIVLTQHRDGRTEVLESWRAPVDTSGVVTAEAIDRAEVVSTRETVPRLAVITGDGALWIKPSDNLGQPETRTVTFFARSVAVDGTMQPDAAVIDFGGVRVDREWGAASVGDAALVCGTGDDDEGADVLATAQMDVWCVLIDRDTRQLVAPTRVFDATGDSPGVRALHVGGGDGAGFVAASVWDGAGARFAGAHIATAGGRLDAHPADNLLGEQLPGWDPPRTGPWSWSDAGGSWWVVGGWGRHDDPTSRPPRAARVTPDGTVIGRRQIPPPASFTDRPLMLRGAAGPWFVYDDYDAHGRRGIVGYTDDQAIPGVAPPPIGPAAVTGQVRNGVVSDGWAAMVHLGEGDDTPAVVAIVDAVAFGDPARASTLIVEDPTGP